MFSNLLVVCVGNICRSPMAEAILRQRLDGSGIQVASAGLDALVDHPMDPLAEQMLSEHRISLPGHRARQLRRSMLHRADLILLMESAHLNRVVRLAPETRGKVFLIGKWQPPLEIADPFRHPKAAFEQTYAQLWRCVDDWLPYLQSGGPR